MPSGYYVINGKSFPDTQPILVKHGQTVHVWLIGADAMMMHPMHLHGHIFNIVAEDGHMLAQPIPKDSPPEKRTISRSMPGQPLELSTHSTAISSRT